MKSKFFLREMHGSFISFRLIQSTEMPSNEETNSLESVIAYMWQIPATNMSIFLGETNFDEHWIFGPEETADGHMMGGHHEGKHIEITKQQADEFLTKCKKSQKEKLS